MYSGRIKFKNFVISLLFQMQEANVRKLTANVAQNGSGTAYKPPVASAQNRTNTSPAKGSLLQLLSKFLLGAQGEKLGNMR